MLSWAKSGWYISDAQPPPLLAQTLMDVECGGNTQNACFLQPHVFSLHIKYLRGKCHESERERTWKRSTNSRFSWHYGVCPCLSLLSTVSLTSLSSQQLRRTLQGGSDEPHALNKKRSQMPYWVGSSNKIPWFKVTGDISWFIVYRNTLSHIWFQKLPQRESLDYLKCCGCKMCSSVYYLQ